MNLQTNEREFQAHYAGAEVVDSDGRHYTLSNASYLGGGKDGEVFKISDESVAKLYYEAPLATRLNEKLTILCAQEKLGVFHRLAVAPQRLLRFKNDVEGSVAGFCMRYLPESATLDALRWHPGLSEAEQSLQDRRIANVLYDLCDVITTLHRQRVIICDLKPENVLIADQRPYLIDFDSCAMPNYEGETYTPEYLDPLARALRPVQLASQPQFSPQSDWWALAVIAFELFMGYHPWSAPLAATWKEAPGGEACDYRPFIKHSLLAHKGSAVRSADWLLNKPALLDFFVAILSPDPAARLPIASALEDYLPREDSTPLSSDLFAGEKPDMRDESMKGFVKQLMHTMIRRVPARRRRIRASLQESFLRELQHGEDRT